MSSGQQLDLLLKGGHVIDPANDRDGALDVGIANGKIARVEADIPTMDAGHIVDVSGLLVTPGLLDIHVHAYVDRLHKDNGSWMGSLNADAHLLKDGVTTAVDVGTAGCQEMEHFRKTVIEKTTCRILALVNIAAPGMGAVEQDISNFDVQGAASAAKEHSDVVVGIKTAHYWTQKPFDAEHPPWESVERAVDAGEACGMPVMVDFWPRPPERPYSDLILEKLRPGDIHTHVFARQFPVIDDDGKVYDYMFKARERGTWFDIGHGGASFWFRNGARAIAQGFPPDSISTDLHMGNINGPVVSMTNTMAKCLVMGMSLKEVIWRSTVTPAEAINRPELGRLTIGDEADVAVLEHKKGSFSYEDCGYGRMDGEDALECVLTVRKGEVEWDRDVRTVPKWEDNPAPYWEVTQKGVKIERYWR